jgi:5-(carboxyamino)imidazole ribonucleotide synthase
MLNLIGSLPDEREVLSVPGTHLHLYGKAPRPGRKLGHVTLRANEVGELEERLGVLRGILGT